MRKIISLLLILVMVLGLCACGSNESKPTEGQKNSGTKESTPSVNQPAPGKVIQTSGLKLTELGTTPVDLQFVEQGALVKVESDGFKVLDMNGNDNGDGLYDNLKSVPANGICVVDKAGLLGVVNGLTGEELVPCEAVRIRTLSDRFLMVCYETEAGTQDDSFDSYSKDGQTVYYKGYGQVYDLQKERFVPDVQETKNPFSAYATSEMVFLKDSETGITTAYDANGKNQGTYEHLQVFSESDLVVESVSGGWRLYDGSMKQLSMLKGDVDASIPGTGEYLLRYESENGYLAMSIIDLTGEPISDALFADVEYLAPGYFVCGINEDGYVVGNLICDLNGQTLSETPVKQKFFDGPVFHNAENKDELLILQTGEFYEVQDSVTQLCMTLILDGTSIVDLMSGEVVFENVDRAYYAGDNLYVFDFEQQVYIRYLVEYAE